MLDRAVVSTRHRAAGRASLGTLAAVGIGRKRIARLLGREGLVVAAIGATLGVAAGIVYAWLMISGLRTWWLAAISTPFLELHVTPRSLVIGWLIGVVVSWLTIRWSIRRLVRMPVESAACTVRSAGEATLAGMQVGRRLDSLADGPRRACCC